MLKFLHHYKWVCKNWQQKLETNTELEHSQLAFLPENVSRNFVFEEPKERWRLNKGNFIERLNQSLPLGKQTSAPRHWGNLIAFTQVVQEASLDWYGFEPKFLFISKTSTHCKASEAVLAVSQLFCQHEITPFDFEHHLCNAYFCHYSGRT